MSPAIVGRLFAGLTGTMTTKIEVDSRHRPLQRAGGLRHAAGSRKYKMGGPTRLTDAPLDDVYMARDCRVWRLYILKGEKPADLLVRTPVKSTCGSQACQITRRRGAGHAARRPPTR